MLSRAPVPDPMAPSESRTRQPALREFQQRLSQRLQQARQSPAGLSTAIAVDSGCGQWLFALAQTAEIIALTVPTPVPLVRPWYLGVIHHRSEITGVIDLDGLLGAPVAPWRTTDRLLVLATTLPLRCAIRVVRVQTLPDPSRLSVLPRTPDAPSWVTSRLADGDGGCWDSIDADALLRDPAFIDIGRP
jgi:twitching motility protein PilI